jgi:hypothetical protein
MDLDNFIIDKTKERGKGLKKTSETCQSSFDHKLGA